MAHSMYLGKGSFLVDPDVSQGDDRNPGPRPCSPDDRKSRPRGRDEWERELTREVEREGG